MSLHSEDTRSTSGSQGSTNYKKHVKHLDKTWNVHVVVLLVYKKNYIILQCIAKKTKTEMS